MKRIFFRLVSVAVLLAFAAAAGYWAGVRQETPACAVSAPVVEVRSAQVLPVDEILGLKAKIAGLEQQLKSVRDQPVREVPVEEPIAIAQQQTNRPAGSFQDRMDRMKQENPEAYAEMQKRREEFKVRMQEAAEKRTEFFASFNQSNMTPEHKANYDRLTELQAEFKALSDARESGQEMDRDAVRAKMDEATDLYAKERQYLLEDLGRTLGSDGGDFAAAVSSIIGNTDPRETLRAVGMRSRGRRP